MYVSRKGRGMGQTQPALPAWGFISPCGSAAPASTGASTGTPTTAPAGAACAPAATFPFFGTADNSGTCQPASPTVGLAAIGVGLVVLWGIFGGRG